MYVASAQHCDAKDAKYLLPMTILTGVTTIIGFAVASPLAEKHPRKLSLFASVRHSKNALTLQLRAVTRATRRASLGLKQ